MKAEKKFKLAFKLMLVFYMMIPSAFLIMPAADFNTTGIKKILAYLVGVLFWLGTIMGSVFLMVQNSIRKRDRQKGSVKGLPGILNFFSCRQGKLIDKIFIVMVILSVVLTMLRMIPYNLKLVSYAVSLFFAVLHSVFNGKNYVYLKKYMKG